MNSELPKNWVIYKAFAIDHYSGNVFEISKPLNSWEEARSVLQSYYNNNKPNGMPYDNGGYIQKIELDLAYNPATGELLDEFT